MSTEDEMASNNGLIGTSDPFNLRGKIEDSKTRTRNLMIFMQAYLDGKRVQKKISPTEYQDVIITTWDENSQYRIVP